MVALSHSRRRLHCLLAMALFAWLMLAVAPFGAWLHAASTQASATTAHTSQGSMPMSEAGCCGDHAGQPDRHASHSCNCALPCAGALPSAQAGLAALSLAAARYPPPRPIEAPLSGHAPPLRPPLA